MCCQWPHRRTALYKGTTVHRRQQSLAAGWSKLLAITLSGAIAGAVGAFYAVVLLVVTPVSLFGMLVSAQALTVTLFGGVGTVWGPVIGSAILIPAQANDLGGAQAAAFAFNSLPRRLPAAGPAHPEH